MAMDSSDGEGMPGMPPGEEESLLSKLNNFNVADWVDDHVAAVEQSLRDDTWVTDIAHGIGGAVKGLFEFDEEHKQSERLFDPGIFPEE